MKDFQFGVFTRNPGRFGPGSFRPESFRPGSFRPNLGVGRFGLGRWVDSALGRKTYLLYAHYLIRICSVLMCTERKIKINIEIYDGLFL